MQEIEQLCSDSTENKYNESIKMKVSNFKQYYKFASGFK